MTTSREVPISLKIPLNNMENIIEVRNLKYKYDSESENYTLNDVSFQVKKGEWLSIVGHNGSGKSTTVRLIDGLLEAESGDIIISGDKLTAENVWEKRRQIGMVFQNPDNQLVATIVEEDVAFGPENLGVPPQEIRKRVDDALEKVGMSEYKRHAPHLLSGGQKQRIAIAGILAMQPKCIIFDEPTAMLDPSGRKEVMNNIKELNKKHGITVILITHYMDEAAEADRVVVMDKGKVIIEGIPRDVLSEVETMKKIGLDVPQVTEICYELQKAGVNIDTKILNVNEMVSALCQLK